MKILSEEIYRDGMITYDFDSLFTPSDALAFIESIANNGWSINSSRWSINSRIGVIYISEDSIRKENKFFGSVEEFKEQFPTIDWEDLDRISISGENIAEYFHGDIRPTIYGGHVFIAVYKKRNVDKPLD